MYNLIVGFIDGEVWANRMLESTDDAIRQWVTPYGAPHGTVDISRLASLPTLVMPELQNRELPQVARVGDIADLAFAGGNYRFRFQPNPTVPAIPSDRIERASRRLHISEFNRSYWAVKDVDLYRVLHESILASALAPKVFRLPLEIPAEQDLVAVMMPFDDEFDNVYDTLQRAVTESGMRCYRADDIWDNIHIMDDVINLIWRARVVIADFTSKNSNVFYETGIAHTLGRDVIPIAQSMDDIPFDLRGIRSVLYPRTRLADLKAQVVKRLKSLTTS